MKKHKYIILIWIVALIIGSLIALLFPFNRRPQAFQYGFPLTWYTQTFGGNQIEINKGGKTYVSDPNYTDIRFDMLAFNIFIDTSILGGLGTFVLRIRKKKSVKV